jgi:hypothetical protein
MFQSKIVCRTVVVAALAAAVSVAAVLPTSTVQDMGGEERATAHPGITLATAVAGTWQVEANIEGMPPSTGTSTFRTVAKQWSVEEFKGDFGGMPYEGVGITGWDAKKEKMVGVWAGSEEAKLEVSEGAWDAATRTLTNDAQEMDLGAGPFQAVGTMTIVDDDHMTFTMRRVGAEEGAAPVMDFRYTRKQ